MPRPTSTVIGKSTLSEWLTQFIAFALVGGVATVGHYSLYIPLVALAGLAALPASCLGALFGAGISYALNYRLTFHSDKRHREALSKFAVVAGMSFLLNGILVALLVDFQHWHWLLGQLVATAIVLVWNFLGNRLWTFATRQG